MLAVTASGPFTDDDWRFEVKWDGWRAQVSLVDRLRVRSRHGYDLLERFAGIGRLAEGLRGPVILDGELVAIRDGRPAFGALAASGAALVFVAFDCLYDRDGWALEDPLDVRLERLASAVAPGAPHLVVADGLVGAGEALYAQVRAHGLEGVMAKRRSSRYQPGRRSPDWQKVIAGQEAWCPVERLAREDGTLWAWVRPPGSDAAQRLPCAPGVVAPDGRVGRARVHFRELTASGRFRHGRVLALEGPPP
ncbi:MAG: hypothetical protein K6V97_11460 [Actinomycetia bacterium]|nr:hypothetical protein [Actinomycetes bacterium]